MNMSSDPAERLLEKVRAFAAELQPDERELFAALIGPGVALAHRDLDDVEGYASSWEPRQLPEHLATLVRERGVHVVGL